MQKLLLCRPQGGLNDQLCQIERCCRYAERFGRHVVVDTNAVSATSFSDDLSAYFESRQRRLSLSAEPFRRYLDSARSVFPACLSGRVNTYQMAPKQPFQPLREVVTNEIVSFDFERPYHEEVLIHHQEGGGILSLFFFLRVRLRDALKIMLFERLAQLRRPLLGVHVRHTDYVSDIEFVIRHIAQFSPRKVFVATDSAAALEQLRMSLVRHDLVNFSRHLSKDHAPLHLHQGPSALDTQRQKNEDAILDLVMLALSDQLLAAPLTGRRGGHEFPQYSGFTVLADHLRAARPVLERLLEPFACPDSLT